MFLGSTQKNYLYLLDFYNSLQVLKLQPGRSGLATTEQVLGHAPFIQTNKIFIFDSYLSDI